MSASGNASVSSARTRCSRRIAAAANSMKMKSVIGAVSNAHVPEVHMVEKMPCETRSATLWTRLTPVWGVGPQQARHPLQRSLKPSSAALTLPLLSRVSQHRTARAGVSQTVVAPNALSRAPHANVTKATLRCAVEECAVLRLNAWSTTRRLNRSSAGRPVTRLIKWPRMIALWAKCPKPRTTDPKAAAGPRPQRCAQLANACPRISRRAKIAWLVCRKASRGTIRARPNRHPNRLPVQRFPGVMDERTRHCRNRALV